jgi:hypothetical protein
VDQGPTRLRRALPIAEEGRLRKADPVLDAYVAELRRRHAGRAVPALRRLERLWQDYPREPVLAAVQEAQHYGMFEVGRLERMVLRKLAGDYFRLRPPGEDGGDA